MGPCMSWVTRRSRRSRSTGTWKRRARFAPGKKHSPSELSHYLRRGPRGLHLRREGRSLRPPIFLETISRPALILGESGDLGAVQALTRGEKTGNLQRSPNDSRGEIEA